MFNDSSIPDQVFIGSLLNEGIGDPTCSSFCILSLLNFGSIDLGIEIRAMHFSSLSPLIMRQFRFG